MDLIGLQREALKASQKKVIELEKALAEQEKENSVLYSKLSTYEYMLVKLNVDISKL